MQWHDGQLRKFEFADRRIRFVGPELTAGRRNLGTFLHAHGAVHTGLPEDPFELQHATTRRPFEAARSRVYGDEVDVRARAPQEPGQFDTGLGRVVHSANEGVFERNPTPGLPEEPGGEGYGRGGWVRPLAKSRAR